MHNDQMSALLEELKRDEGYRPVAYRDTVGAWTIGYGRNLDSDGIEPTEAAFLRLPKIKRYFGPDVFSGRPLSLYEAHVLLVADIQQTEAQCRIAFNWFDKLSDVRQRVVLNMVFNMGLTRFKGFKKMIAALIADDFEEAARQMFDSLWREQVKGRAYRLIEMMKEG